MGRVAARPVIKRNGLVVERLCMESGIGHQLHQAAALLWSEISQVRKQLGGIGEHVFNLRVRFALDAVKIDAWLANERTGRVAEQLESFQATNEFIPGESGLCGIDREGQRVRERVDAGLARDLNLKASRRGQIAGDLVAGDAKLVATEAQIDIDQGISAALPLQSGAVVIVTCRNSIAWEDTEQGLPVAVERNGATGTGEDGNVRDRAVDAMKSSPFVKFATEEIEPLTDRQPDDLAAETSGIFRSCCERRGDEIWAEEVLLRAKVSFLHIRIIVIHWPAEAGAAGGVDVGGGIDIGDEFTAQTHRCEDCVAELRRFGPRTVIKGRIAAVVQPVDWRKAGKLIPAGEELVVVVVSTAETAGFVAAPAVA